MNLEEEGEDLLHLINVTKKQIIAGIDEVGKGALFGPVFAGAVILKKKSQVTLIGAGLKDSKLLTSKSRATLVPLIKQLSMGWGIGEASVNEIELLGIREATEKAMLRAIYRLPIEPELLLIDGVLPLRTWEGNQKTLIKGDRYSPEIAAASVLAKEARDSLIRDLASTFPKYSLEKNVGYGTEVHRKALQKFGPTKLHRLSFLSKIISPKK